MGELRKCLKGCHGPRPELECESDSDSPAAKRVKVNHSQDEISTSEQVEAGTTMEKLQRCIIQAFKKNFAQSLREMPSTTAAESAGFKDLLEGASEEIAQILS